MEIYIIILIGILGLIKEREIIKLISLELIILGIILLIFNQSLIYDDLNSLLLLIFILAIGATETAIGFALII